MSGEVPNKFYKKVFGNDHSVLNEFKYGNDEIDPNDFLSNNVREELPYCWEPSDLQVLLELLDSSPPSPPSSPPSTLVINLVTPEKVKQCCFCIDLTHE